MRMVFSKQDQIIMMAQLGQRNGKISTILAYDFSPIPPGDTLIYNFTVRQHGTYWIHSHVAGQYPDGLRSPLIIKNPLEPFKYDHDITITVSDWYHESSSAIIAHYMSSQNPTAQVPAPQSALMNDVQNLSISFEPSKYYRMRFVNVGAFANFGIWIEDHEMHVIEVDGVYTEEKPASMISITPGQRVSVLVKAKDTAERNYALLGVMNTSMMMQMDEPSDPSKMSF
jgi:iron transport multicopper oxidase